MKDQNYITVQGWMVNRLKLSGNELMVYAVIYGFSQDEKSGYEGGGKYLTDSCGISRRALTDILEKLIKKEYVLRDYFIKNINGKGPVKFCRYKTNPDFIPKTDKNEQKRTLKDADPIEGGMAETAIGGMANSAIGVWQKLPRGYGRNCHRGMANSANNNTTDINLHTTAATAAPKQPDLIPEPPPGDGAAAALSPEIIKQAILDIDRSVLLKADFYARAAAFMALNHLDKSYIAWLYKQTELRNPDNFEGLFFTLFFAENIVEKFIISKTPPKPPPPVEIKCPACGFVHGKELENCPSCSLPSGSSPEQISVFKDLLPLPREKREEYFSRERDIIAENGFQNFEKCLPLLLNLKKEFGVSRAHETPSRSYHP